MAVFGNPSDYAPDREVYLGSFSGKKEIAKKFVGLKNIRIEAFGRKEDGAGPAIYVALVNIWDLREYEWKNKNQIGGVYAKGESIFTQCKGGLCL